MKTKILLLVLISCGLLFLLSGAAFAQKPALDSYDQAALLMLNSKNKMQDTQDANELRQLAKYYEDYYNGMIADLQASGNDPDGKLVAALQQERDEKTAPLLAQANTLDAARQNRPKNNVVRKVAKFFGRVVKGAGRAVGFGVSKTMEGISKGAQIVVEEIGHRVIEDVVRHAGETIMSGGTLEGQALRRLVGELFQRHAKQAIKARLLPKVVRAAERILGQQAAQAVAAITENQNAGLLPSGGAEAPAAGSGNTLDLTPEELLNQGTHHYLVSGTTTCSPVEEVTNDPAFSTHEFTVGSGGVHYVNYTSGNGTPRSFTWVSPNTYEYNIGGGWDPETIIFTLYGYDYHRTGSCEVHFSYVISD